MPDVVCDASPLIVLAKVELLHILPRVFGRILLPGAVAAEIERGPDDDPMKRLLGQTPWLVSVRVDPPLSPLATWQMGPGESEVIEYARAHENLGVLLDDRAARRAAAALNLRVYGTLAVLASAARGGWISSFRSAAELLVSAGLRVAPRLIEEVETRLREQAG
jgi:predicted nucleic acid-binding protein